MMQPSEFFGVCVCRAQNLTFPKPSRDGEIPRTNTLSVFYGEMEVTLLKESFQNTIFRGVTSFVPHSIQVSFCSFKCYGANKLLLFFLVASEQ